MQNNLIFLEKRTLKPKNRSVFFILSAALLPCNAIAAGAGSVDVTVQVGMTCPGVSGSVITNHLTLSVGGLPNVGYATSVNDLFSVGQTNSLAKCSNFGVGWSCEWYPRPYSETPYGPPPNSFLRTSEHATNIASVMQTTGAGSWGGAWYYSAKQNKEFMSGWSWGSDSCGFF